MSINIVIVVTYLIFLMIWTFSFNLCCRFYLIHATSKIAYAYYFGNCCLFNPVCFFRLPVIICVCLLIFCGGGGGGGEGYSMGCMYGDSMYGMGYGATYRPSFYTILNPC